MKKTQEITTEYIPIPQAVAQGLINYLRDSPSGPTIPAGVPMGLMNDIMACANQAAEDEQIKEAEAAAKAAEEEKARSEAEGKPEGEPTEAEETGKPSDTKAPPKAEPKSVEEKSNSKKPVESAGK